ncbi:MAG: hypothetical protein KDD55_00705 [Bdellovibrionales bacterium]|nr:hypothetical protein [Bdellovibrionales bacterium]
MFVRLFFFILVALPLHTFAESGPADLVQEMIGRLKSTHKASVILEYIHWGKAFESFPEQDKTRIRVHSPAEMRSYFETFF